MSYDPAWEPVINRGIDAVLDEIASQVSRNRPLFWWGWQTTLKVLRMLERRKVQRSKNACRPY